MQVKVLDLVGTDGRTLSQAWQQQQSWQDVDRGVYHTVSSSQVRHSLSLGDMKQVSDLLVRQAVPLGESKLCDPPGTRTPVVCLYIFCTMYKICNA